MSPFICQFIAELFPLTGYLEHPINKIDNGPFLPRFELVSQSSALSWLASTVEIIAIDIKEELASPNNLLFIAL